MMRQVARGLLAGLLLGGAAWLLRRLWYRQSLLRLSHGGRVASEERIVLPLVPRTQGEQSVVDVPGKIILPPGSGDRLEIRVDKSDRTVANFDVPAGELGLAATDLDAPASRLEPTETEPAPSAAGAEPIEADLDSAASRLDPPVTFHEPDTAR